MGWDCRCGFVGFGWVVAELICEARLRQRVYVCGQRGEGEVK